MAISISRGLAAWLATDSVLPSGVSAADSSLNSSTMLAVSAGQLPPASATVWNCVQEISTGSLRAAEQGYSQSTSMPSAPYCASQDRQEAMKVARVAAVAAILLKYSEGKFQPPTDSMTRSAGLAALKPVMVARKGTSCGSTLMS